MFDFNWECMKVFCVVSTSNTPSAYLTVFHTHDGSSACSVPPIRKFIYRVSSLWLELGVSSVIVVGGCGDYFDVHNTAILVDNYAVFDATERAHSVSVPRPHLMSGSRRIAVLKN